MKKLICSLVILSLLLCGCAANNATVTTTATTPTTTEYNRLQSWSDRELLEQIAYERVCNYAKFSSVSDVKFGIYGLKSRSAEFAELLTRDTAVESIKAYVGEINKEYTGSGIVQLLSILDDIEAYIAKHSN